MATATKAVLDQAREAFASDSCPACGLMKRTRQDWFCKGCWWKLDRLTRATIANQWRGWLVIWMKAVEALKKLEQDKYPA